MKVLVIGGAGYIGSHFVKYFANRYSELIVLDNLSTGFSELVQGPELIVGAISDISLIENILVDKKIDIIVNFASFSQVNESISDPLKYYQNNVGDFLCLLQAMKKLGKKYIINSSSAAVYGIPTEVPILEKSSCAPINPYGTTKLIMEKILEDAYWAYGINSYSLRFFNAAGADRESKIGELHNPETHLIPLVLQVASGRRAVLKINGFDYDTFDGTCIRDYVHVMDIARAHEKAISFILKNEGFHVSNLGSQRGHSIKEIIKMAEKITCRKIQTEYSGRRIGDPAVLIANSHKARNELGWNSENSDMERILVDAWNWEKKIISKKIKD